MSDIEKQLAETENEVKEKTFHYFDTATKEYGSLVEMVKECFDTLEYNSKVPNTAITAKNKVIELMHLFKRHNLSIFAGVVKTYNEDEKEIKTTVGQSFVGNSIIVDIVKKLSTSADELKDLELVSREILEENLKIAIPIAEGLHSINPIKRIISRIQYDRYIDVDVMTEEEYANVCTIINAYKDIDDWLFNYNLKNNVVGSVRDYVEELKLPEEFIDVVLKLEVIPTFKQLELEGLVPDLQKSIKDLYNPEKKKPWQLDNEELDKITKGLTKIVIQASDSEGEVSKIIVQDVNKDIELSKNDNDGRE